MKHDLFFYPKKFLHNIQEGVSYGDFTKDAIILLLNEYLIEFGQPFFLVLENEIDAGTFYLYCEEFSPNRFVFFPSSFDNVPGFNLETNRLKKDALLKTKGGLEVCCITTNEALHEPLENNKKPIKKVSFRVGEKLDFSSMISSFSSFGYLKKKLAIKPGSFAVRGDVVDVFPSHFKNPFRLSFEFEKIEQISLYDPLTQLPTNKVNKLVLYDQKSSQTIEKTSLIKQTCFDVLFLKKDSGSFIIGKNKGGLVNKTDIKDLGFSSIKRTNRFKKVAQVGEKMSRRIFVGLGSVSKGSVFSKNFFNKKIKGHLSAGFYSKEFSVLVVAENELTNTTPERDRRNRGGGVLDFPSFSEMKVGDHIVHKTFGIGIYGGVVEVQGGGERVKIKYLDGAVVYVSLDQLSVLQRYVGSGKKPPLSKIGSKKWKREVVKAREAAQDIAVDVINSYSNKRIKKKFSYVDENELEGEPSASFPYIETKDQKQAIKDVLLDMSYEKPMDRLVCGDVGFGKTEVAIRAIFKAFLSNLLSVFLCPTTILADQHYITCKERLGRVGIKISLLSRFRSPKSQKKTIHRLKERKVDVLIGTHRILSKDVDLVGLGLLIIDEEHRFGVKHKEQIKNIKNGVDVLTLTATPIPRTLQQSLTGLKDITTILTPPKTRRPILTSVRYFNWDLIYTKIEYELNRSGQVYFLNNNIQSIPFYVDRLRSRFENNIVAGASGKMPPDRLEETILSFFDGKIDILVCTTIIESGLDVVNANTMIVKDSQNLGLSQLYQIRGRVGRGKHQAHCFLLIPKAPLEKDAQKRLLALEKNTSLGSGYNISMLDLEIRGSGSLFGYRQSGHISLVGFQMYCDLLSEELKKKDGDNEVFYSEPEVSIGANSNISKKYISTTALRIDYYYRIARARSLDEIQTIEEELLSGFGEVPEQTKTLFQVARIRVLYTTTPVEKINIHKNVVELVFNDVRPFVSLISKFEHKHMISLRFHDKKNTQLVVIKSFRDSFVLDVLFSFVYLFDSKKQA